MSTNNPSQKSLVLESSVKPCLTSSQGMVFAEDLRKHDSGQFGTVQVFFFNFKYFFLFINNSPSLVQIQRSDYLNTQS